MKPVSFDYENAGSEATAHLAAQLQWALNNFLYANGLTAEKPPAEPPKPSAQLQKERDAQLDQELRRMRAAKRQRRQAYLAAQSTRKNKEETR